MWLHYVDPHTPYFVPESVIGTYSDRPWNELKCPSKLPEGYEWKDYCTDLYDEEIKYTDQQIGGLIDKLKEKEILNDTILVITADHGEAFGERGYYFHLNPLPYQEIIHIPLIIKGSKIPHKRIKSAVDLTKIAPTALNLLNISSKK